MPKRLDTRTQRSQDYFASKVYETRYEPRPRYLLRSAPPEFAPQLPGEDDLKFLLRQRRELKARLKYYTRVLMVYPHMTANEREDRRLYTIDMVKSRMVSTVTAIRNTTRDINRIRAERRKAAQHRARRAYEEKHPGRRAASLRRAALRYVREHPGERNEYFLSILRKETKRP